MEIHQLQYVIEVAKHKHFTRAADEINVGQSTLSQQIAKLEGELGVKLFDRTSRTVHLTPAGIEFVQNAQQILAQIEALKQCMNAHAGLFKGVLHIGTITSLANYNFGKMIASFHNIYPGISLNIIQEGSLKLIELLRSREIDIAFLTLPPSTEYEDLNFYHLANDEYVLVTGDKHPFAGKKVIDLAEAHNENFIFQKKNQSMYAICMKACNKAGFHPKILCHSSGASISFGLISEGLGIGFFPIRDMKTFRISGLASIKLREPLIKNIMLTTLKPAMYAPSINVFYQHAIKWIGCIQNNSHTLHP